MLPFDIPFPDINPEIVRLGPLAIRWYSLSYIAGIAGAFFYVRHLFTVKGIWDWAPKKVPPFDRALLEDYVFWAFLGIIVGGRIGYLLFYGFPYNSALYLDDPLRVLKVWEGGMSFHGGFLGVVAATIWFSRKNNLDMFLLADLVAGGAPIGLLFGRLANFINGELWGRETDVAWGMVFPNAPGELPRHPSQLYEAGLEGLVLFLLIMVMTLRFNMLAKRGFLMGFFFAWYGAARIFVEFFRDSPTRPFGPDHWLTQGMLLSFFMVVVGAWFMWKAHQPESTHNRPVFKSKPVSADNDGSSKKSKKT